MPVPNFGRIDLQEKKLFFDEFFFKQLFQAMKFMEKNTGMVWDAFLDTQTPIEKKLTFFHRTAVPT